MYLTTDFNLAGVVWMLEMVSDRLENLVLGNPIEQEAEDRYVSEMETGGMVIIYVIMKLQLYYLLVLLYSALKRRRFKILETHFIPSCQNSKPC